MPVLEIILSYLFLSISADEKRPENRHPGDTPGSDNYHEGVMHCPGDQWESSVCTTFKVNIMAAPCEGSFATRSFTFIFPP